jgi:OmpA-OmpF porin, OOP family
MKKYVITALSCGVLSVLVGCAHSLKPATMAANVTPSDELSHQSTLIDKAYTAQVDVLAPDRFSDALKHFEKAKKNNKDGAPTKVILMSVAYSRSYLEKATEEANHARSQTSQIIITRQKAIAAGARRFPQLLSKIDKKLMSFTDTSKISISMQERNALQDEYSGLELHCIKEANLGSAKETLKVAKDKNAEKITPKAYAEAWEKTTIAEKFIEINRSNSAQITKLSNEATVSAKRVLSLLESEKISRNQTPEQRAVNLETKKNALIASQSATAVVMEESQRKDDEIANQTDELNAQDKSLASAWEENREFKARAMDEVAVRDAAARFDQGEADVYRQNGVLIIRLKSMNFASSRSDLPADSLAVLAKVREVIVGFGPGKVTVEGHTDGVGQAGHNLKLSEERAQSVVKYFTADESLLNNEISSVGYGYSKPLGTNKTAAGRSQNRRVDIKIQPDQSI